MLDELHFASDAHPHGLLRRPRRGARIRSAARRRSGPDGQRRRRVGAFLQTMPDRYISRMRRVDRGRARVALDGTGAVPPRSSRPAIPSSAPCVTEDVLAGLLAKIAAGGAPRCAHAQVYPARAGPQMTGGGRLVLGTRVSSEALRLPRPRRLVLGQGRCRRADQDRPGPAPLARAPEPPPCSREVVVDDRASPNHYPSSRVFGQGTARASCSLARSLHGLGLSIALEDQHQGNEGRGRLLRERDSTDPRSSPDRGSK